jgi:hypothetical protein
MKKTLFPLPPDHAITGKIPETSFLMEKTVHFQEELSHPMLSFGALLPNQYKSTALGYGSQYAMIIRCMWKH